jgi:hypothetical protein
MNFTKIRWAGEECILITSTNNHECRVPLLILSRRDIDEILNKINTGDEE